MKKCLIFKSKLPQTIEEMKKEEKQRLVPVIIYPNGVQESGIEMDIPMIGHLEFVEHAPDVVLVNRARLVELIQSALKVSAANRAEEFADSLKAEATKRASFSSERYEIILKEEIESLQFNIDCQLLVEAEIGVKEEIKGNSIGNSIGSMDSFKP